MQHHIAAEALQDACTQICPEGAYAGHTICQFPTAYPCKLGYQKEEQPLSLY